MGDPRSGLYCDGRYPSSTLVMGYFKFSLVEKVFKQPSSLSKVWVGLLCSQDYVLTFLSCVSLLNFVLTFNSYPSFPIYTLVLVGLPWWGNILPDSGSLHPRSLGGFLGLVHNFIMPYHISEIVPNVLSFKWHFSKLCSTQNLVFGGRIPLMHYFISSAYMDICWNILLR